MREKRLEHLHMSDCFETSISFLHDFLYYCTALWGAKKELTLFR